MIFRILDVNRLNIFGSYEILNLVPSNVKNMPIQNDTSYVFQCSRKISPNPYLISKLQIMKEKYIP